MLAGRDAGVCFEVRYTPVGVVAAFTPWNLQVYLSSQKLAAALAADCSVALKPSEEAPGAGGSAQRLGQAVSLDSARNSSSS